MQAAVEEALDPLPQEHLALLEDALADAEEAELPNLPEPELDEVSEGEGEGGGAAVMRSQSPRCGQRGLERISCEPAAPPTVA